MFSVLPHTMIIQEQLKDCPQAVKDLNYLQIRYKVRKMLITLTKGDQHFDSYMTTDPFPPPQEYLVYT